MKELDQAAERFAVGEVPDADLSLIAAEALARGLDSPALVELACLHRTDTREAPVLFRTALAELGHITDSGSAWAAREAAVRLRRARGDAAALLAEDDLDPVRVSRIAHEMLSYLAAVPDGAAMELSELAYCLDLASYALGDSFRDPDELRDEIRQWCSALVHGSTPPSDPTPAARGILRRWWRRATRTWVFSRTSSRRPPSAPPTTP
ncbi:hypothetical protein [Nocardia asteroides]|uniref:hypothetical protein n=1 Tax=Nocardia asteroides TaxID=1824 RepID=UPI001E335430|nr:hypothetical protein [Nocardia asteroides]UGT54397.1 hypothetical protein LTT85_27770 [Nocardia asteroides]